jgi:hypothetical protein
MIFIINRGCDSDSQARSAVEAMSDNPAQSQAERPTPGPPADCYAQYGIADDSDVSGV